jgi:hypothetical protein
MSQHCLLHGILSMIASFLPVLFDHTIAFRFFPVCSEKDAITVMDFLFVYFLLLCSVLVMF